MNIIKDLYAYRELLKTNITKDVGGKYKHSFLGVLWSFFKSTTSNCCICISFPSNIKK